MSLSCVAPIFFIFQMRMRRLRHISLQRLFATQSEPHKRVPGPGLPLPDSPVLEGPNPDCLRAELGAEETFLHGARVSERIPGNVRQRCDIA